MDLFLKFISGWRKAGRINISLFLFAFLALAFISYSGVFNNVDFLSGTKTQSFFSPPVARACSSNDYACLSCEGVSCGSFCYGYDYYYGGYCDWGSCYFNYEGNSSSCGHDPCAGVSCGDYCTGDTLWYSGHCSGGGCYYLGVEYYSPSCGFTCDGVHAPGDTWSIGSCACFNGCTTVPWPCNSYTCNSDGTITTNYSPSCSGTCHPVCSDAECGSACESGTFTLRSGHCGCNGDVCGVCVYTETANSPSCGYVDPCANVTCNNYCGGDGYTYYTSGYCSGGGCSVVLQGDVYVPSCTPGSCTYSSYENNNVTPCGYDPCAGVSCGDYCTGGGPGGYDYAYGGTCQGGGCTYAVEENSPSCGYDPCAGVSCGDYCVGGTYTLQYGGYCSGGNCYYSPYNQEANSPSCGCSLATYYRDADGDGYGNPSVTTSACSQPAGYVTNNTDCNDSSASIHPVTTQTQSCTVTNECSNTCTGTQANTCQSNGTYSAWSACGGCTPDSCVAPPSSVSAVTAPETSGGGGLSVSWPSVGASGYRVYVKGGRTNPNNAVLISDTSGTSAPVTLSGQCPGSYTVTVVAYNSDPSAGVDQSCTNAFSSASLSGATVPSEIKCSSVTVSTVLLKSCTGGFLLE